MTKQYDLTIHFLDKNKETLSSKIFTFSEDSSISEKKGILIDIFPLGINVNAWHILKKGSIKVKTYERGVQRLTQSCGTGSMSCASVYATSGLVSVSTPGGDLKITLEKNGIELQGPAFILSKEP